MAKNKIGLQLEGFEELIEKLESVEGDAKRATEECLRVAHNTVTPKLHADMAKHRRTGKAEQSITDSNRVTWDGPVASIDIGFDLKHGGMPSIFLMYGTPRMNKDSKLYNDIYGSKVKKEIAKKQQAIFEEMIQKRMGG